MALGREVLGSFTGLVKSPLSRQRLATAATFLRSCFVQALSGDELRHSLHASVQYHEYNEDLIFNFFIFSLKDLPKFILVLLRNPAFLLVSIANALDFGLISGFSAFTPKYLESMFGLTPTLAAYYLG